MSAFCVETRDRTLVFAALKEDCIEWVEKLCQSTFQKGVSSNTLEMQENHIYASADEEFWVTVQRTDAATRCDLKGSYWLQVGREALLLREPQKKNIVGEWPYELLRRYGKDKLALTIEAGRRCESGPGTFTFETQQAEKIFSLIQGTIKWKTSSVTSSSQNQEGEKVIAARAQAHSPLPKILDVMGAAGILGTNPKTGGGKSPVLDNAQEDVVGSLGSGSVQPAPITLMPLPQVPTHDSQSPQPEAVYAEPADCIKSVPKATPTMSLYVDPASILPLKPPNSRECGPPAPTSSAPSFTTNHPDPVYSEVYDKISPVPDQQTVFQSKEKCFADDEPIYTEPVSKRDEVSLRNGNKPDPFAHLYAQVCKTTSSLGLSESPNKVASSSSHTASMNATNSTDDPLDDVIYENLGII